MSTELMTLDPAQYPVLAGGGEAMQMIRDNMGGEDISEADLTRIRVPAGGGTAWAVPTSSGTEESMSELTGVIVHVTRRRAYWPDANPTGDPPMCVSADCVTGVGEPGGGCAACPNNQFGSAIKPDGSEGRGKSCKETKLIFMLREGGVLPDVVVVPAASLKIMRHWQLNLRSPYWSIVTSLGLTKAQNKDGVGFAQVAPRMVGQLEPQVADQIREYSQGLAAVFAAVSVDEYDVDEGETTEI